MKKYLFIVFAISIISCNNDNYIDTGLSNGVHDCSMYEYFQKDSYNWDTLLLMIDRAGLKYMFDGSNTEFNEITFFGPCNHSIRYWMAQEGYDSVNEIPQEVCKTLVESYILKGKYKKNDFDFEIKNTLQGGTFLNKYDGVQIRVFLRTTDWEGKANAGPVEMYAESSKKADTQTRIASANIETNSGIVHSLSYTHKFGEF